MVNQSIVVLLELKSYLGNSSNKDARDSNEMKEHLNMGPEDKLLGAFVFGEVDASKQFKSARRPIDVEFRTD